jgi:hypothetical protein
MFNPSATRREPRMTPTTSDSALGAPVQEFFSGLAISTKPTSYSVNGRRVYILVRPEADSAAVDEPWTDDKNRRRYELSDKEIDGTITIEEALELEQLNVAIDRWIQRTAPLPMDHVRKLHDSLVAQLGAVTPETAVE